MTLKLSFVLCATLAAAGCAAQTHTSSTESVQATEYIKTSKPGAAVSFSHDYDGTAVPGETRQIRIQIEDGYAAGNLQVSIASNEALSISNAGSTFNFNMAGENTHEIVTSVKALSDGIHYINIKAVAEYESTQVARSSFAIVFNAGVEMQKGRAVTVTPQSTLNNPGVIVMEAEEEIIIPNGD